MNKQERYDRTYLNMATEWAKLSHCSRKQVGALMSGVFYIIILSTMIPDSNNKSIPARSL